MPTEPSAVDRLLARVRAEEDPSLAGELAARMPPAASPRPVSVTDLLAPRRAFWRRKKGPAPFSPEREFRLHAGRRWHERFGDAVADEGVLEVRVRRGGVSARIDLWTDVPVEVKTGSDPAPSDRDDQIEQLAAYCALAGSRTGRLVHLALRHDDPPAVTVGDLTFRDLPALAAALQRREAALRSAIAAGEPTGLARCRWFEFGCEFRAAGLCDCRGDEPPPDREILEHLESRAPADDAARRWTERLAGSVAPASGRPERFRDLLFPRRAYFRRTVGGPPEGVPVRPPSSPLDAYERVVAALESGPAREVHRLVPRADGPAEEVLGWKGWPCALRSTRVHGRLAADDLVRRFPQYLLDLGFRAAACGSSRGVLVVAYEHPVPAALPVQVFGVDFTSTGPEFGRLWTGRANELDAAVRDAAPDRLAACPGWMTADCAYRASCGCAADAGRSQR